MTGPGCGEDSPEEFLILCARETGGLRRYSVQATEPSVRTPQTRCPTLTDVKLPESGEAASPKPAPQQTIEPSVRTPQLWLLRRALPVLTEVNVPDGGEAWPSSLFPQHAIEPSVRTPQAWFQEMLTEVKLPDGGVAWP